MELNHLADRIEKLSAQYAEVYDIERSGQWALLKLTEEVGELAQAHLTASGQSRDRGRTPEEQERVVADELGDVLGMCLVYARQMGIDPEQAVADKWFRYERAGSAAVGQPHGANGSPLGASAASDS
ncbi:MazG nucleotide pyrophosphohydrolase domain-containing protein [Brachybacterium fresconis]|uniref:NTP pyrophosphatase (Non-canonical NTP hydrolase) n=1 Tax=Brachybacterium fresconis TaxID=173363 RepID=A0ABS4YNU5_9MICO|nr:MazG nucleotide pyrophosphohydrolase domain-containing protein [Brachybacterium fresconis]MBP2410082.1 NTP pyrophosphatase (non-canonical NTP hydrolase) [Brachybacterium fresconis]